MSNFLSTSSDDGLPYIQWGSDAVQWSKKEGEGKVPFTFEEAVIDMHNLDTGWIKIGVGIYDAILQHFELPPLPRPEEKKTIKRDGQEVQVPAYDKGFGVKVLFPQGFGDDRLFSWSTSQKGSLEAMSNILDKFLKDKDANPGKCPAVTFKGHVNVKKGKGSSNVPQFEITKWVDRPAEFDAEAAQAEPQAASGGSEF